MLRRFLEGWRAGFAVALLAVTAAQADDPKVSVQLEPVRVTGTAHESTGYRASEVSGATGMPIDPTLVPQAVTIVTPQMLEHLGATRMGDALPFVSGVSSQNDFGGMWDNYSIRGFEGDINRGPVFLRDGVRANRGYTGKQDAVNLERIEILRGSSSALIGRADPGGAVNIVTKRPSFEPSGEVTLAASSDKPHRATFDYTGPLSDSIAGRISVAVEDGDTFRDHVSENRFVVAPAFSWILSDNARVHYDGEFSQQKRPLDRGVMAVDNRLGVVPVTRFLNEPDDGDITLRTQANRLRFQTDLSENWSSQLTLAHMHSTMKGDSTEAMGQSDGYLIRERRHRDYESDDLVASAEIRGSVELSGLRHDLLLGAELSRYEQDFLMRRSARTQANASDPYAFNIYNPVYGSGPIPFDDSRTNQREDAEDTLAFYVQDLIHVNYATRVLVGGRFDRFEQETKNLQTGVKASQRDNAVNPRVGVSHDLTSLVTVFANASRAFNPNSGADRHGDQFDPETSTSYDIGLKTTLPGGLSLDASLFQITKENVLTRDPVDAAFSVAAGEVRSRGIELDVNGKITESLSASFSYSYTDAHIVADGVTFSQDTRLNNVPRNQASLLTNYGWKLADRDASIGGGIVYVDSRVGNQSNTDFTLPSYSTVHVRAAYKPRPDMEVAFIIDNLLDKEYYTASYWEHWVTPGAPRNYTLQLTYQF